ncbi:hypothetical protein BVG16_04630 [Paenibacillus selenitireducens]|uniref:Uncharacterized protein n=1 Tax=Paenibacillus selenitireducens TaxID=1324314 RepID=A0A1T2XJH3_9BACL|nr:hypothetical protein [Paenibacillus selenitireducens]OPA80041.1 hypothetical protein BVG16_04630 [Paenibacillus selenitireducens]
MEQFVQGLYSISYYAMAIILALVTIAIFIVGVKMLIDRKRGIGTAFVTFAVLATGMIYAMLNMKFL